MTSYDMTTEDGLISALSAAVALGKHHALHSIKESKIRELITMMNIVRWYGGHDMRYSYHLAALMNAYRAGRVIGNNIRR